MKENSIVSQEVLADYLKLVEFVEQEAERMQNLHTKHITCKKGCSSCCLSFRVFAAEREIIHKLLQKNNQNFPSKNASTKPTCKYLLKGVCSIYQYRPIMCRTHGFPLLYLNEDEDAYEFSTCELNFSTIEMSDIVVENCISMDEINNTLYSINSKFLEENKIELKGDELLCSW